MSQPLLVAFLVGLATGMVAMYLILWALIAWQARQLEKQLFSSEAFRAMRRGHE